MSAIQTPTAADVFELLTRHDRAGWDSLVHIITDALHYRDAKILSTMLDKLDRYISRNRVWLVSDRMRHISKSSWFYEFTLQRLLADAADTTPDEDEDEEEY